MTNVSKSYTTHGKMDLQAIIKPGTAHYIVQWSDGGQVPEALSGTYTSLVFLDQAINTYINNTIPVEKPNEAEKAIAKYEKKQAKKLEE